MKKANMKKANGNKTENGKTEDRSGVTILREALAPIAMDLALLLRVDDSKLSAQLQRFSILRSAFTLILRLEGIDAAGMTHKEFDELYEMVRTMISVRTGVRLL